MSQELDTSLIGQTAAQLMEDLPQEADGEIIAVGVVVIVDAGESTYTRVKTSSDRFYEQLGVFHAALHVVASDDE
jgi:hypothetical protein